VSVSARPLAYIPFVLPRFCPYRFFYYHTIRTSLVGMARVLVALQQAMKGIVTVLNLNRSLRTFFVSLSRPLHLPNPTSTP
jgi:hypothetical protein